MNVLHKISGLGPEPVLIRSYRKMGAKDHIRITKVFKDLEFGIKIEKLMDKKVHIHVKKTNGKESDRSIRATLSKDENDLYSFLITGKDEIVFEFVPYGSYSIFFTENGSRIGNWPFVIKE